MKEALLWDWKAPIINDFYVMIYYGLLKRFCQNWCDDQTGALQNDLICGEGGVESAEPAKMLLRLASIASQSDDRLEQRMITKERLHCRHRSGIRGHGPWEHERDEASGL